MRIDLTRGAETLRRLTRGVFITAFICATIAGFSCLTASGVAQPAVPSYGEVARFGGLDANATYSTVGSSSTTNLNKVDEAAKLVYPVGMTVDTEDPTAPDKYAIYVLENINPQALNNAQVTAPTSLNLEYRIQKISDIGTVLASTTFTLPSSESEPGLHAVSLAVDGPADRVYVLIMDVPPVAENGGNHSAIDAIDAWTTGRNGSALEPAVGLTTGADDKLSKDHRTGAGELVGSSTLQGSGAGGFFSDIDGASIAVYGRGPTADLAIGGNQYAESSQTTPVIKLIKTAGVEAGKVEATTWGSASDVEKTENAQAKLVEQHSNEMYALSTNSDGSLNLALGGKNVDFYADLEPNMATVGTSGLTPTAAILPGSNINENLAQPEPATVALYNIDSAATLAFSQDIGEDGPAAFMPSGATKDAGTLAPSVTRLDENGSNEALYAGLVTHLEEQVNDRQNPVGGTAPTWKDVVAGEEMGIRRIESPANLAIRIFNPAGESLGMIGNATPKGPCNLQSSPPVPFTFHYSVNGTPSFVALAAGREGVVFALVQPDLLNVDSSGGMIAPTSSVGASEGDQIVEFAPGPESTGAGMNASKWRECPQPEGGFSITDEKEPPSTGTGEVAVRVGAKVKFDAEEVSLHGGSPWAYDWTLEGGVNKAGEGPLFEFPWTVRNTFTAEPENGSAYTWPLPIAEAEFKTPGSYTETLNLVNDFGTLTVSRKLRVVEPGKITNLKVILPAGLTEGAPALLKALATLPADDKVKDYHWEFGDGLGEDTGEHAEVEHAYARAGGYTVKLTVTDVLGQKAQVEENVIVEEKEKTTTTTTATSSTSTSTSSVTSTTTTKTTTTNSKPAPKLTKAQKLAAALKACKKDKPKKKRVRCEKKARAKYGAKPKSKSKSGHRKK